MILKVVLVILGFALGTCFGIALGNKSHLLAVLTVIGTVGAVIWAVARDTILKYINKPKLNVNFYETDAPYLRYVPPDQPNQPHQHILTLNISNSGRSVAKSCQPLITKLWFKNTEDSSWIYPEGWVPLPLDWVFESQLRQKYVNERDIVPDKPYLFNLCVFLENNSLVLTTPITSRSQTKIYKLQTSYCIELTLYSVNAKTIKKYFSIHWKGNFELNLSSFEKNVWISDLQAPPIIFRVEKIDIT